MLHPFTFKREAYWLLVLCLILPTLALLAATVLPACLRWFGGR